MRTLKIILAIVALGIFSNLQAQQQNIETKRKGHFLQKVDTNADGKVSLEEFNAAKAERDAQRLERRKEHFDKLDTNKDGAITFEEFTAKSHQMHDKKMVREALSFESLDTDKDGFLTTEELKALRKNKMHHPRKRMGKKIRTQSQECRKGVRNK